MTRAVGIFGSDAAVKRLHAKLRSERVYIERHNFRHPDDMLSRVYEEPDIAAVLLVEKALKEMDPDVTVTLEYIRANDSTLRIIFIKDEPERDYPLELWCYERGIYDVAYPIRLTDVNIDAIRDAVLLGRIDPDNPPPPPLDPNAIPEQIERVKLRDRFSIPDIKLPEWKIPSLSEFTQRFKREPREDQYEPELTEPQVSDIHIIGTINCSRGFGATSLTVGMAECLSRAGRSVAVIAMDLSPDLEHSGLQELGVTVVVPSGDQLPDWITLQHEHDVLLIDFGAIYEFLPSGGVIPAQSGARAAIAVREAMSLCDVHIYLASDEPWHTRKAKAFKADDKGFVMLRQDADASTILHKLGVIYT